ncbi:MAG: PH domain-containing protein [Patescibacteria group bacterium]
MEDEYSFRGKRSNESVLLVVRCHPWILMPIVWFWLIVAGLVVASLYFFGASQITTYVILGVLILGGMYSFYIWFLWNNGTYVMTNQRVIRIDQLGIFRRQISEAEIDRIQEISTEIDGPIRTMLNFGDVKIQTASREGRVVLEDVVDPYDIQQQIVRVQREMAESTTAPKRPQII